MCSTKSVGVVQLGVLPHYFCNLFNERLPFSFFMQNTPSVGMGNLNVAQVMQCTDVRYEMKIIHFYLGKKNVLTNLRQVREKCIE